MEKRRGERSNGHRARLVHQRSSRREKHVEVAVTELGLDDDGVKVCVKTV